MKRTFIKKRIIFVAECSLLVYIARAGLIVYDGTFYIHVHLFLYGVKCGFCLRSE